jgi:Notch-like protein
MSCHRTCLLFLFSSGQRRQSRRRGPDGQEMRNLNKQPPGCIDVDIPPHAMGGQHGGGPQWSDDESDLPPPKRIRACEAGYASDHTAITDYDESEPRMWAQQHLEAADIRQRPDPAILTPPSLVRSVELKSQARVNLA